jgi:DNA-binding transcriptional LysR family regulator
MNARGPAALVILYISISDLVHRKLIEQGDVVLFYSHRLFVCAHTTFCRYRDKGRRMTNIPTDLLRTLIAVVDLRSFTKAAASLGVTQPAVSAQIKRLQFLLGSDLFDRSAQGVSLTPHGETVVSHARRLLSINDQIIDLRSGGARPELVIRLGTPSDFVASVLPDTLARFRTRWPEVRYNVRTDFYESLMRQLRGGDIDVMIALSATQPNDARHYANQEVVWVRGSTTRFEPSRPVPLVTYGEPSVYHRLAVKALRSAGLEWDNVFTGPSLNSVTNAVVAGLGVMAITRRRAITLGMTIWEDAPLPKLPDLYSGVYVREGGTNTIYEQLADEIATVIHTPAEAPTNVVTNRMGVRLANTAA